MGELLLTQSPHEECEDPAEFKKEIADIVGIARRHRSSMRDVRIIFLVIVQSFVG